MNLTVAVRAAIEARLSEMHTILPGVVESYNPANCSADVKPGIKRRYIDGTLQPLPVIPSVPVIFPRTKNTIIHFPLDKGDSGALLFSERSIDVWLSKGGDVDPEDPRSFHLADAIFIPGLFCFSESNPAAGNPEDFVADHKGQRIIIKANGDIEIGKDAIHKVVNETFKELFNNHVHNYIGFVGTGTVTTGVTGKPAALGGTGLLTIGECPIIAPNPPAGLLGKELSTGHLTSKVKAL